MIVAQPQSGKLVSNRDPQTLLKIRYICAHVLAMGVQTPFPETKVTIGP
jgi:threonyl-tRNA synthetase